MNLSDSSKERNFRNCVYITQKLPESNHICAPKNGKKPDKSTYFFQVTRITLFAMLGRFSLDYDYWLNDAKKEGCQLKTSTFVRRYFV